VVTGASRGIGKAISLLLAKAGANITVCCNRNLPAADEVAAQIQEFGSRALVCSGDVSKRSVCESIFEKTSEYFGPVDILIANAGIWKRGPIDEMSLEEWQEMIETNLTSIFHLCQLAARQMKKRRKGRIILIGSTAGQRGEAFHSHYAASKGAIQSLTKSLAAELGPSNIRVNTVAPGWVDTDMSADILSDPELKKPIEQIIPLGRVATAEEIAGPVLFLASELSDHVQGEILNVNGGSVLCG
jgi:3-oxoacyl-[acyl-carrier protein] reductase